MNLEREYLKYNILSTSEAAELFQVSRQRVNHMVKEGKLTPIKNDPLGMLFLRADIQNYIDRDNVSKNRIVFTDWPSTYTSNSVEFYKENIEKLSEIKSIFIYNDDFDAVINNFYFPDDMYINEKLRYLLTPKMIIRDIWDQEIWLMGCNCGYGGEGPRGTNRVIQDLIIQKKITLNLSSEKIWDLICGSRVINIYFDPEGEENIVAKETAINNDIGKESAFVSGQLYLYASKPVLMQSPSLHGNDLLFFNKYRAFVPNPVEILLYTDSTSAIKDGYIFGSTLRNTKGPFKLIIKDQSGRELWLQTNIAKEISLQQHENLNNILVASGFEIVKDKSAKLTNWLNKGIKILSGQNESEQPIVFTNK